MSFDSLREKLSAIGQQHVLRFYSELDAAAQRQLLTQLEAWTWTTSPTRRPAGAAEGGHSSSKDIQPITPLPQAPQTAQQEELYADAAARGQELLKAGKVGHSSSPAARAPAWATTDPRRIPRDPGAEQAAFPGVCRTPHGPRRDAGKVVPWYIMTSDANDAATRAFFVKHSYFGYDKSAIFFFQQGMMPAFRWMGNCCWVRSHRWHSRPMAMAAASGRSNVAAPWRT